MNEKQLDSLTIQLAFQEDFVELQNLLDRANQYSVEISGLPAWRAMDNVYGTFHDQVKRGECFVARRSERPIAAAICLSDTTDKAWGEAGQDGQALYFTKFIKNPAKVHLGEGRAVLDFAAAEALRRHKPFLRCDTVTELQGLIDYYVRLGFARKGAFTYTSTGRPGVLLQASAAALLGQTVASSGSKKS